MGLAINDYEMIKNGDRIAVGLSGGMDSLALLLLLHERLNRIPATYELFPVFVDNFNGENSEHNARIENLRECVHEKTGLETDVIKISAVKSLTGENSKHGEHAFYARVRGGRNCLNLLRGMAASRLPLAIIWMILSKRAS